MKYILFKPKGNCNKDYMDTLVCSYICVSKPICVFVCAWRWRERGKEKEGETHTQQRVVAAVI